MKPGMLIEFAEIDLGTTPEPWKPCEPVVASKPQTYYPSLYIDNKSTSFKDVPDEGTATIKYRVTSRSSNWRDGKEKYGMNIDVLSIDPKKKLKELNAILDERLNEFDSTDPRPRTPLGTFDSAAQSGAPDPLAIKRAYTSGRKDQSKHNMGYGTLAALAVGAAGYGGHKLGKAVGHAVGSATGLAEGRAAGAGAARKMRSHMAGKTEQVKEGLGSVIKRQQGELAVRKDVEKDNIKALRDMSKRLKKHGMKD